MSIQNVVFDIGNVFVLWEPTNNLHACFPQEDAEELYKRMLPKWLDLNTGKITLDETLDYYHASFSLPREGFELFCRNVIQNPTYVPGARELQARLHQACVPLYCISDNIKEGIAYYRQNYPFMQNFDGAIISADVGVLKPDPRIYRHLFDTYHLDPATCVFFDDVPANVEGAQKAGMAAFVFTTAEACEKDLRACGLAF